MILAATAAGSFIGGSMLAGLLTVAASLLGPGSAGAGLLACAPSAPTSAMPVPRPTDGGRYGYGRPEAKPYFAARAVIHYVTDGPDAPDLADADRDGAPDYVEAIAQAADRALAYYEAPVWDGVPLARFRPACDSGGGSPAPDVYVKRLPEDAPGLSIATERAAGGGFALVSPRLENPRRSGGVQFTTAHELFHLVQFAYVPRGMPPWIAEGTANALAFMSERIDLPVLIELTKRWYRVPWIPLFDDSYSCDRCYGSLLWWASMTVQGYVEPSFVTLSAHAAAGKRIGLGLNALEEAFAGVLGGPLASESLYRMLQAFSWAQWVTRYSPTSVPPATRYALTATTRATSTTRTIRGFSAHFVPLTLPRRAQGFTLSLTRVRGARRPLVIVLLGVRETAWTRVIEPRFIRVGNGVGQEGRLSTSLTGVEVGARPVIVITSNAQTSSTYRLTYRACAGCPERGFVTESDG